MTSLHIATPEDLGRVLPMLEAAQAERGAHQPPETRAAAVGPLLDGAPHGVIYLIGPRRSPVGFIAIAFGWSLSAGGLVGRVDEFWIRDAVRGRGMGGEALLGLSSALAEHGLCALSVALEGPQGRTGALFTRCGFRPQDGVSTLSLRLA